MIFLSGGKGVHIGVPVTWPAEPSTHFPSVARSFCLELAGAAGVAVDAAIYSRTRLFRAPNSRHPKTGLYKSMISLDEITYLKPERIVQMVAEPAPFEVPTGPTPFASAASLWRQCVDAVERRAERQARASGSGAKLQALTLDFIRNGAVEGERETRLFQAAANLAELGCSAELAHALLAEAALDSGLPPGEVRRAIDCGLAHVRRRQEGGDP
ncbi:MAG: hypothetical protein IRY99_14070 [Isosphaeraceae bacterium]|nr:hypothetical protein [Isosphaeraceae bacterium]